MLYLTTSVHIPRGQRDVQCEWVSVHLHSVDWLMCVPVSS